MKVLGIGENKSLAFGSLSNRRFASFPNNQEKKTNQDVQASQQEAPSKSKKILMSVLVASSVILAAFWSLAAFGSRKLQNHAAEVIEAAGNTLKAPIKDTGSLSAARQKMAELSGGGENNSASMMKKLYDRAFKAVENGRVPLYIQNLDGKELPYFARSDSALLSIDLSKLGDSKEAQFEGLNYHTIEKNGIKNKLVQKDKYPSNPFFSILYIWDAEKGKITCRANPFMSIRALFTKL